MITFTKKRSNRIPYRHSGGPQISNSKYTPLYRAYLSLKEGEVLAIPLEGQSVFEYQNKISTTIGMFTRRHALPKACVRRVGDHLHVFPSEFGGGMKNILDSTLDDVRAWKAAYDREQEAAND